MNQTAVDIINELDEATIRRLSTHSNVCIREAVIQCVLTPDEVCRSMMQNDTYEDIQTIAAIRLGDVDAILARLHRIDQANRYILKHVCIPLMKTEAFWDVLADSRTPPHLRSCMMDVASEKGLLDILREI